MVAEVKASAADQGFHILEGQCFQTDSTLPYAPLLDLFRAYFARLARLNPKSLSDTAHSFASMLSRLLPDLALLFPDAGQLARVTICRPGRGEAATLRSHDPFCDGAGRTTPRASRSGGYSLVR